MMPPPRSTRHDTLFPYTTHFRSRRKPDRGGHDRRFLARAAIRRPARARRAAGALRHAGRRPAGRAAERRKQDRTEHADRGPRRSEEHTSELQSLMRISYAVFCLKKKQKQRRVQTQNTNTVT